MKKFVTAERCRLIINSKSYTRKKKRNRGYRTCLGECGSFCRVIILCVRRNAIEIFGLEFLLKERKKKQQTARPQQQANKTFAECARFTRKLRWRLQIIQHHHVMFGLYLLFIVKTILWLATKGMLFRCLPLSPRVSPSRTRQTSSLKKSQRAAPLAVLIFSCTKPPFRFNFKCEKEGKYYW